MSAIGEKIRRLRTERGLSQKELATLIGVTAGAVGNWEAGTRETVRGEALFKLADALGVGVEDLLVRHSVPGIMPIEELQLMATYRQLTSERKRIALALLKALKNAT